MTCICFLFFNFKIKSQILILLIRILMKTSKTRLDLKLNKKRIKGFCLSKKIKFFFIRNSKIILKKNE